MLAFGDVARVGHLRPTTSLSSMSTGSLRTEQVMNSNPSRQSAGTVDLRVQLSLSSIFRRIASRLRSWVGASGLLLGFLCTQALAVTYVYDEQGRLTGVINGTAGATYNYDAAGNLLSITPTGTVSIMEFTPNGGPASTAVSIYGTGFSTTIASNTVKFNGTTATVTSATANKLVATVPTAATTGPISVTVGTNTAASTENFVVGASTTGTPMIASFTPGVGIAGTAVTISGTNFDPNKVNNKVQFNGINATVSAATATRLTTSVPTAGTTGPITVATPRGTVASATDFVVPPPGMSAVQFVSTGKMTVGGAAQTVSIATGNSAAVRTFVGTKGQYLTLGVTSVTFTNTYVNVYAPDGSLLGFVQTGTSGGTVQLPPLPTSGVYSIVVSPSIYTGSCVLTLAAPVTGSMTVGGAALPVSIAMPGRRALIFFAGTAGQYVSLAMTGVTLSSSKVSILKPDGSTLVAKTVTTAGASIPPQLPVDGTYSILIDPAGAISGNMTLGLTLSSAPAIALNGAPGSVSFTLPITAQTTTFFASAGQFINVGMDAGICASIRGAIIGPDGSSLTSATFSYTVSQAIGCNINGTINTSSLQVGGTYTLLIECISCTAGGVVQLVVSTPTSTTLASSGSVATVSMGRIGQGVQGSFTGIRGESISVGVNSNSGFCSDLRATLLRPNGTTIVTRTIAFTTSVSGCMVNGTINAFMLAETGTYTVLIEQVGNARTGGVELTLSTHVAASVVLNGATATFPISRRGQGIQSSFSAPAGQFVNVAVRAPSDGTGLCSDPRVAIYNPDSTLFASITLASTISILGGCSFEGVLNAPNVPVAGSYTLLVEQSTMAATGSLTITLSTATTGSLTLDGPSVTASMGRAGQGVLYTFAGTAGQTVSLGGVVSQGLADTSGTLAIQNPSGTAIAANDVLVTCSAVILSCDGSVTVNVSSLPATGTYSVLFHQRNARAGPLNLTLSTTPAQGGMLTLGGGANSLIVTRPGQMAQFFFAGAAGQLLRLTFTTSLSGGPLTRVFKADGTLFFLGAFPNGTGQVVTSNLDLPALPATEIYRVLIEQGAAASTGSVSASLAVR